MKLLLTGPAGSGKTHRVLMEFVEALKKADDPLTQDHFLLLPSSEHVERITTLMLQQGLKGFFYHRVTTLSDFIRLQFGIGDVKLASSSVRFMFLKDILSAQSWPAFEEVQHSPGFLNLMLQKITELKESLIYKEEYRSAMNQMKRLEPELASKYESLARIYELYEERLFAEGFCDRQDLFKAFQQKKKERPAELQRFKQIWLDGFFDFSTLQLEYLREIAACTENITVTLTKDEGYTREKLFDAVIRTEKSLLAMDFKIESLPAKNYRTQTTELSFLERNLFLERKKPPVFTSSEKSSVQIFEAVGIEGEVEMIARAILSQVKSSGIRFSDIAVLLRQIGNYESVIQSVFERYEIPVEIHERPRLKLSSLIQPIVSLVKIFQEDWKREDLFNFLKSSYVSKIGGKEKSLKWICRLEHESLQRRMNRGREFWLKNWDGFKSKEEGVLLNQEKSLILGELAQLEDLFKAALKMGAHESLLMKALDQFGISHLSADEMNGKLESNEGVEQSLHIETLQRDSACLRRIHDIMDEIRTYDRLRGRPDMNFTAFAEHFLKLVEIDLYSTHHLDKNRVQIYGISLARQKEYKVVFIAGLLEKQFPMLIREDPILSDWERRLFNAHSPRKLGEFLIRQSIERYFFYLAVTRAEDQVFLTYPKLNREGKEALPSFYVEEVKSLLKNHLQIHQQDLAHPYPKLSDVMNEREFQLSLIGGLWHEGKENEVRLTELAQVLTAKQRGRDLLARSQFKPAAEITDTHLIEKDFFQIKKTSPTRLEEYAKCHYKYFAHRVLKLQDPNDDVNIKNKGIILHHVLETFFKESSAQGLRRSEKQVMDFIDRELAYGLREYPLVYEKLYQYELACEELRDMLVQFLPAEIERLQSAALQPRYMEFSFGAGEKPDAAPLPLEGLSGAPVHITGKIDRIDTDQDGHFGLVIDYKRSAEFKRDQLELGVAFQLPLYMKVAEKFLKLKPVGGELYSVKEVKLKGFYHKENAEGLKELSSRALKLPAAEFEQMLEHSFQFIRFFISETRKANISVEPRVCESYCPYATVCRIEKWRLEEILDDIKENDKQVVSRGSSVLGKEKGVSLTTDGSRPKTSF